MSEPEWFNAHSDLWFPEDVENRRVAHGCSLVGPPRCPSPTVDHFCYEPLGALNHLIALGFVPPHVEQPETRNTEPA